MGPQVQEAREEVEALRRLVKLKTRELKNVRRLAQVRQLANVLKGF